MNPGLAIGLTGSAVGLAYAVANGMWVLRQPRGEDALQAPYRAIRQGAVAFLRTQYLAILGVGLLLALVLLVSPGFGWLTAAGFAVGGACSAAAGAAGMLVSTAANVRTTAAARLGLPAALRVSCAGMAADLFESYVVTIMSSMLVAAWVLPESLPARFFPLAVGGVTVCAAVIGVEAVRLPASGHVLTAFLRGVAATVAAAAVGIVAVGVWRLGNEPLLNTWALLGAGLTGIAVAVGLAAITAYYTGVRFGPVHGVARASSAGHATNIIAGLALGMKSTALPVLVVAAGVVTAYGLADLYGLAIATTTMLALTPMVVTVDAFGPVTDNAGGIAEMSGISDSVREITDKLDAAGNTTKAVTKAFAIGSAGLAALVLFAAYEVELRRLGYQLEFTLNSPYLLAGLLIGGVLPSLFGGFALEAVGRAATEIVAYVRAQFDQFPDILEGRRLPDYAATVFSLTRTSIREMLLPGLIPVAVPLVVGLAWPILGPPATAAQVIGGMLIGSIVTGLLLAIDMCTGGAAWDNAKKYIEAGHAGGKGSATCPT